MTQDLTTLLGIPPLIKDCTFLTTELLVSLRFVSIISNASFPFLPPYKEMPKHLLSLKRVPRLRLQNILIILLASTRTKKRYDTARESWIRHLTYSAHERQECTLSIHQECAEYFRCCLNISVSSSAKMIVVGDRDRHRASFFALP